MDFIIPAVIHGLLILLRFVIFGFASLHVLSIQDWKTVTKFSNFDSIPDFSVTPNSCFWIYSPKLSKLLIFSLSLTSRRSTNFCILSCDYSYSVEIFSEAFLSLQPILAEI